MFRSGVQKLAGCRSALEASSISLSCSGRVAENRARCQGAVSCHLRDVISDNRLLSVNNMSNLSRSILDRLVNHTSVTFDGMISAFWL